MRLNSLNLSKDWFLSRSVVSESGCWVWQGAKTDRGYGKIVRKIDGKRKEFRTHRLSLENVTGPLLEGECACHKCDNTSCCNPDHLFKGTQTDNVKDMYAKDRSYDKSGHSNPRSKLTPEQVQVIRNLPRCNQKELAVQFGISQSSISRVQRCEVY
jgi:hypothetical protein